MVGTSGVVVNEAKSPGDLREHVEVVLTGLADGERGGGRNGA